MKKKHLFIIALFFSFVSVLPLFAAQKGEPNDRNAALLKIRSQPNKQSSILAKVNPGEEFDIIYTNSDNWHKVKFKDIKGWVNAKYVKITGSSDADDDTEQENEDNATKQNLPPEAKLIPDIKASASKTQVSDKSNSIKMPSKYEIDFSGFCDTLLIDGVEINCGFE